MRRGSATVHGKIAYFGSAGSSQVQLYNSDTRKWSPPLPECRRKCFTLTIVKGYVTAVGGWKSRSTKPKNTLLSLVEKGGKKEWVEKFTCMLTKRKLASVVCSGKDLVVAGGKGEGDTVLTTVEVMDTDTLQWSPVSSLPDPLSDASATLCGDCIYLVGGFDQHNNATETIFTCSLRDLLQSQIPGTKKKSLVGNHSVWHATTKLDPPVKRSTCVTLHEQLLVVGGHDSHGDVTNKIYLYNRDLKSWEKVDNYMPTARDECLATVLPDNKLMVVGGETALNMEASVEENYNENEVEIATVQ